SNSVSASGGTGVVWREVEGEAPTSPGSSGYAGERGSSNASSASGIEEIGERDGGLVNGIADSQPAWVPGKRHVNEDDASVSWRKRKKHFFILSNSGKPIYSRYGDEHKLAGFSATLQAIISFVENGGDRVKLVRAGKHQVVFLVKGPIYLVCISCTEEPYESLRGQLELLYGQMILILTKSVNRCFEKNSKFDMTPLLGGTDAVFSSLIHSFSCLWQLLGETDDSLANVYVLEASADTYLMLLTTRSDAFYHLKECRASIEAVFLKSNVLSEVQRSMLDGGMHIEDLPVDPTSRSGSASSHLGQHSPERFRDTYTGIGGPCGLWHFIYRSIYLDQYVSSEFSSPINTPQQQKRLFRAYQKIYASMHDKGFGPHKTQFRRDENYVLLCWVTQDFELYAAFDPLADKALAIKTCNRVCQWVKDVENEIFLLGASPFSW
uniref:Vacuolar fusion protein MON1 homolog n=1 Tax=Chenopodium quinoa TaxID=63459 RepID=A0A803LXU4_CHEQI